MAGLFDLLMGGGGGMGGGLGGLLGGGAQPQGAVGDPWGGGMRTVGAQVQTPPSIFQRLLDPTFAIPMAAGMMGDQGNMANIGQGFANTIPFMVQNRRDRAQVADRNRSYQWLRKTAPEYADLMDAGMSGQDAVNLYARDRQQQREAQMPKYDFAQIDGNLVRYDERGRDQPQVVYRGQGARPMTPDERMQWGIPGDDRRPYFMDGGKPHALGGQGVNVNVGGERGFDKTVGEGYGKRFLDIQEGSQSAGRALNALDVMEQSMSDPGFYSGAGGQQVQTLKRLASSLGMDPNGVQSMETFNAMSKQAALDSMGGSLGTGFSNADREFVLDQVPNLSNTPQGNAALIDVQRKLNQRKQEVAQLARTYAGQNDGRIDAGFDDYLARWAEQNPLFPEGQVSTPRRPGPPTGSSGPRRARNPQTGEVIEWDGGQWRPVQ